MSEKAKNQGSELFEQAMKNYEQALQAGVKLQQDSAKWWTEIMAQAGSPQEWQAKMNEQMLDSIPVFQKRMEETVKVIEQSSRTSLDLVKQAFEVSKAESVATAQAKMQGLWEDSLQALRTNAAAYSQQNTKWVETWVQFAPKAKTTHAARAAA